jgi:hypothetical protein
LRLYIIFFTLAFDCFAPWILSAMRQFTDDRQVRRTLPQMTVKAGTTWLSSLLRPILGFRRNYLPRPLLMVYFAYGALGLIDATRDIWIKERLTAGGRAIRMARLVSCP